MDGAPRQDASDDEELLAQRRTANVSPDLIAMWIGDKLHCVPVAELPTPVHEDCFEGCAACCPPAKGF